MTFDAVLTTHLMSNLHGGLKTGTKALANLDLTADWQGPDGWQAFAYVEVNSKDGFSASYVGDQQYVSNIDLTPGVHLAEAWVQKTSAAGHFVTMAGFVSATDVFDVQDVGALFLNSSHALGVEFSQSGLSCVPRSALGIVTTWHPGNALHLHAGLFDAVGGDPDHPGAFIAAKFSRHTGLQYVLEAEKDFTGGYIKLGHWSNTVKADALDGAGAARRASGTYAQLSLALTHEQDDPDSAQGLSAWLRAGNADEQVLAVDRYAGAGLVYTGLLTGRDHDRFGFAIARARFGRAYRATVEDRVTTETTYELTYQYEVRPGFILQPDAQYVQRPAGSHAIRDALVVGLQVRLGLEAFR